MVRPTNDGPTRPLLLGESSAGVPGSDEDVDFPTAPGSQGSIDLHSDVDTTTTPPADADVLTWVDADGQWEPGSGASTTFGTPAIVLGTAAAAGAVDEVIRRDSTIVAFDATVPVTQAFGDSAATGSAAFAARRDHKHGMPATDTAAIVWVVDGGGSAITTGVKGDIKIPFACTITDWSVLLDQSGSIVFDVWKDVDANYPPTVADTMIPSGTKPTVSAATHANSSSLTGWTTSVAAGDTIRFNVDSITSATRATLILTATRA